MDWIEKLMEETSETECPQQFVYWAGLSILASAVRRNVFLDRGGVYKLYPNLYVLLVADSGIRKSYATWVCKQILESITDVRVISGRNSIQAIIKELGTARTKPDGGPPLVNAQALLVSNEFSTFIIEDPSALTILTDLYDTHYYPTEWRNTLKGTGVEVLKHPCINMIAATAPSHFRDKVGVKDIEGGFVARTVVVYSDRRGKVNPLTEKVREVNFTSLIPYVIDVSRKKGEFQYSLEAKEIFETWYYAHSERSIDDRTGGANRLHDHILKVSMLLSLARSLDLIISDTDMNRAIDLCSASLRSVNHIIRGSGRSATGPLTHQVAISIYSAPEHKISRNELLRNFYGDFDAVTLDNIMRTLIEAKMIEQVPSRGGILYVMQPDCVRMWQSFEAAETAKRKTS